MCQPGQSMVYVTSLTTNGLRVSSVLLSGFISPRCLFLGKPISLELVLTIVHNNYNGNFSPKFESLFLFLFFFVCFYTNNKKINSSVLSMCNL